VGVKDVDTSNLQVKKSSQPFTDLVITAKVKGAFIREKLFGVEDITPMSISVETNNGIVYLTGTAETKEQIDNAVKIARSISGVKNVRYRIQLTKGDIVNLQGDIK
jgi:hyperosmotically inducible protein